MTQSSVMTPSPSLFARVELLAPTVVDRDGVQERLRVTLAGALLALPGLLVALPLFVLTVVALPLTLALVGYGMLLALVPAAQAFTGAYRKAASRQTGEEVRADYLAARGATRLLVWIRDPARWRDLGFLAYATTGGLVLSGLPVLLFVTPLVHLILALAIGDATSLILLATGGPALLIWWFVALPLAYARARTDRAILDTGSLTRLQERVEEVAASRAATLDHSAAELRRIERDLHDGAQARLAAVGMSVGLAERLLATDPDQAATLMREARETTLAALDDLRTVVRGIHPPALADRGLAGAIEALLASLPLRVTLTVNERLDHPGALPPPIESAAYFGVTECLTNVLKHAHAGRAWVRLLHTDGELVCVVGDDGAGGARAANGSGLDGVGRRLAAFDGTLRIISPPGGPTEVTLRIPGVE